MYLIDTDSREIACAVCDAPATRIDPDAGGTLRYICDECGTNPRPARQLNLLEFRYAITYKQIDGYRIPWPKQTWADRDSALAALPFARFAGEIPTTEPDTLRVAKVQCYNGHVVNTVDEMQQGAA